MDGWLNNDWNFGLPNNNFEKRMMLSCWLLLVLSHPPGASGPACRWPMIVKIWCSHYYYFRIDLLRPSFSLSSLEKKREEGSFYIKIS